jgi:hypothetical protein
VAIDAFANWYESGVPGVDEAFSTGVTGSYNQSFMLDRLQGQAALGLFTTDSEGFDGSTVLSALLGLRYTF